MRLHQAGCEPAAHHRLANLREWSRRAASRSAPYVAGIELTLGAMIDLFGPWRRAPGELGIAVIACSPRKRPVRTEESSGRTVVVDQCILECGCSAFGEGLRPSVVIQVRGGKTRIHRIDLDAARTQLRRELYREHVQGGLRSAVSQELVRSVLPLRIGVHRKRAEFARHIDDASSG